MKVCREAPPTELGRPRPFGPAALPRSALSGFQFTVSPDFLTSPRESIAFAPHKSLFLCSRAPTDCSESPEVSCGLRTSSRRRRASPHRNLRPTSLGSLVASGRRHRPGSLSASSWRRSERTPTHRPTPAWAPAEFRPGTTSCVSRLGPGARTWLPGPPLSCSGSLNPGRVSRCESAWAGVRGEREVGLKGSVRMGVLRGSGVDPDP